MNNGQAGNKPTSGERMTAAQLTAAVSAQMSEDLSPFKAAFEHASVGLAIVTPDDHFKSVNHALCDLLGYTEADLRGKRFGELMQPDEAAASRADFQNLLSSDTAMNRAQRRCLRKTGEAVWVELTTTLLRDEQQQPCYFVMQLQDIDQRKQTEEAIRDSEEKLRAIYDGTNDAVMLLNEQGFFDCNPRTLEVFGFQTKEEFTAVHPADVSPPLQPDGQNSLVAAQARIQTAYQQGYNRFEWMHRRTNGEDFPAEVLLSAFDFGGQRVLQATVRDITQRKRLEQQVQESLERRGRQVQTSTEVSQDIAAAPDLNELFQRVVTLIKERFGYYHVQIFRHVSDRDTLVLVNGYGTAGERMLAEGHQLPIGRGIVGTAAASGKSILAADVAQAEDWRPNRHLPDTQGELAVPIKFRDQVLGILDVQSDQVGALSEEDRLLLEGLCGQIAIAIENRQAEETLRQSQGQLSEALRIAQLANWEYDVPTDTFTFNDKFYALLRTTAEREGGYQMRSAQYAQRFVHPEDAPVVGMEIQKALETDDPNYRGQVDHRVIYADGEMGYITVRFTIEKDAQGRTIRTHGVNQDITQRERAQERLRLLTSAVEAAATGIAITDRNGQIEWINPAFTRLTGYTIEDTQGQNPRVLKSGKMAPEFYRDMWQTISAGQVWHGELINRRKDGTDYFEEMTITPVRAPGGEIMHFIAVKQDVTERKHAEENLRRATEGLHAIFWRATVTRVDDPTEGTSGFEWSNQFTNLDAVHDFLPLPDRPGAGLTDRFNSTWLEEDRQVMDARSSDALRRGLDGYSQEFRLRDAKGNLHWMYDDARIRRLNDKQFEVIGFMTDITERKEAEEALAEALKIARLAYWEYDVEKDLFLFNDQFYALFRTTAEQHGGYQLSSAYYAQHFVYPEDLPVVGTEIEKALNSTDRHYTRLLEHRIQYADGDIGYISVSINIDRDEQGKILRYYGANQDITARKRAEEDLRHSQEQLAQATTLAKMAYWELDLQTLEFTFNDQFYNLLRTTAEQAGGYVLPAGQYLRRFVHPEDISHLQERMQAARNPTTRTGRVEYRALCGNGQIQHVLLEYRLVFDAAGRSIRAVGAHIDVTERKFAEAERERLLAQLQGRSIQLQTAAEVSRATSSILDPDELIATAVELVRERFGLYYVGIFLTDETRQWAVLRAGTGEAGRAMQAKHHRLAVGGQSMIGWCIANGRARIALDVGDEAVRFDNPLLPLTRSEMALPLISRGQVVGAATVQSNEPNAFSEEDITVLQTMADQLTVAVANAQLFEQTRRTLDELDALNRRLTGEAWQSYAQDKSDKQAVIWHSSDAELAPLAQSDVAQLAAGQVVTRFENGEAHVGIPMALRGELIGAVRLRAPANRWTEQAQAIATSIAGHLAQAAENVRLLEQTQRTAQREKQIALAADRIHRAADLDRVLQTALEEISRITGAQEVGIQLGAPSTAPIERGNGHRAPDHNKADQIAQSAAVGGNHA